MAGCAATRSRRLEIDRSRLDVGIVGGGYAGMAAAVALAARGIAVTVYESAQRLGGRARAVAIDGRVLDNGQHLLIGAFRDTLRLIETVGSPPASLWRLPFTWHIVPRITLRAAGVPAPWHLLLGLARCAGWSIAERSACLRFLVRCRRERYSLPQDTSVARLLAEERQPSHLVRTLWEPLCVAALNTRIEDASARVFLNVLRDTLSAERGASDMILPRCDLGALFPEPAAAFVCARGGQVLRGTPVSRIDAGNGAITAATGAGERRHAALVLACDPSRAARLAGRLRGMETAVRQIEALRYERIVTVYLQYARAPRLPFAMAGLANGSAQWLFDRGAISAQPGLLAAVISARSRERHLSHRALADHVHAEIVAAFGSMEAPQWTRVIEEKRATFACVPDLERPDQSTPVRGLFLAGDYTASDYPATLEAAVRSGLRCAALAGEYLGQSR